MAVASAQDGTPPENLFQTVRPQVHLTVRRDPNGSQADLIEARSIDPQYPVEQLKAQLQDLGRQLNSQPRGLTVGRYDLSSDGSMTSIKGTCAVDNLIDRKTRNFHLTEIVRAFAGYPKPNEVTGLSIVFVNEQPSKTTLLAYGTKEAPVQVQGTYDPTFKGVEYRIKLNSQKPEEIQIPEGAEQKPAPGPSTPPSGSVDWTLWGLIAVAAIALGALVYSLLIKTTSSKRS
jgi:hypothetical protein